MGRGKRRASGAGEGAEEGDGGGARPSPTPATKGRPAEEGGAKREKKRKRARGATGVEDDDGRGRGARGSLAMGDGAGGRPRARVDGGVGSGAGVGAETEAEAGEEAAAARPRGREFASVEDFELAVASTPNSSYLWIKYMAFALSLADVDRARKVGERALQAISFRDVGERFNVWVARLNLELAYGGPGDADALLAEALQRNDRKKMLVSATGIYEGAGEALAGRAEALHRTACKDFKQSCKVWLNHCAFHMRGNQADKARAVLGEAVTRLPRRKHVKIVSKFAILEFKHGSAERGRTLFEGLVRAHPKRTDLWGLYVAQERRLLRGIEGAAEQGAAKLAERARHRCRLLYERATDLPGLNAKRAKALFKQFLEFELTHAPVAEATVRVDHVKRKAAEFVEKSVLAKQ